MTVGVSRSNRGEAEGFCLGSLMGWGVWAVWAASVWTRRGVRRVGVAGGLKCLQWDGWWVPQGAHHPERPQKLWKGGAGTGLRPACCP